MIAKLERPEIREVQQFSVIEFSARKADELSAEEKAELRRLMYERMARGSALAEAEETSRRKWRGN